ncbi:MAG: GH39 family glycosyl hydrolase, partial [Longimicrobiales bacterium]
HSNAYSAWLEMGAPQQVSRAQRKTLEHAGQLQMLTSPAWIEVTDGDATIELELPHQGVSLLQLSWRSSPAAVP